MKFSSALVHRAGQEQRECKKEDRVAEGFLSRKRGSVLMDKRGSASPKYFPGGKSSSFLQ